MTATLIFDGDCGFCTSSAARLAAWSRGGLEIVAWQRTDIGALGLTAEQCSSAVQFIGRDRRTSGGAAVADALGYCRQPWRSAGAVIGWRGLSWLTEGAYRIVAANRHRLPGSTASCRPD